MKSQNHLIKNILIDDYSSKMNSSLNKEKSKIKTNLNVVKNCLEQKSNLKILDSILQKKSNLKPVKLFSKPQHIRSKSNIKYNSERINRFMGLPPVSEMFKKIPGKSILKKSKSKRLKKN